MAKDKLADTFLEEFKKRPWKSKKLQELIETDFKPQKNRSTGKGNTKRPYWTYDGDESD